MWTLFPSFKTVAQTHTYPILSFHPPFILLLPSIVLHLQLLIEILTLFFIHPSPVPSRPPLHTYTVTTIHQSVFTLPALLIYPTLHKISSFH